MSGQLYAVKRGDDEGEESSIIGIFSTEGLAQTHAASWRMLKEIGVVYTVVPLAIDGEVAKAAVFFATMNMGLEDLIYDPLELTASTVIVADTLPPCDIDVDTRYGLVQFTEYGWSEQDAIQRLRLLMDEFIAMRQDRLDAARAARLAEKQAAAAAVRERLHLRRPWKDDVAELPW